MKFLLLQLHNAGRPQDPYVGVRGQRHHGRVHAEEPGGPRVSGSRDHRPAAGPEAVEGRAPHAGGLQKISVYFS